ncbi:glycosyltransferase family 2 protein [Nocardioides litoris]|uniref:glycosyltransferase family 2 protein n=1 Tax=Nocardioides litoris TaxID=1926648 RepID=UPI001123871B|nr:glycosyltransferase family 2 protein [Nocardioides litoris]
MIVTVSTVKDTLPNIQRFVEGNLAGGADHLVVFLDQGGNRAVESWLDSRPEVTAVVTNTAYWNNNRPHLLNKRQRVNANVAKAALAFSPWADWLFHVDADEVVRIDRAALDAVPAHVRGVVLRPLEVVSVLHPDGEPRQFKRLLEPDELDLLHQLGVLAEPTNSRYFRSHVIGKVGIRPRLDVWLGIHKAVNRDDERIFVKPDPGLRLLHYESYSGDDFVRKWTNMVSSGPKMHFGEHRQVLADGLKTLVEGDLPPETKARYLERVYRTYMEDPVADLDRLGLLVEVDVRRPTHTPTPLPDADRALLRERLDLLRDVDKLLFIPDSPDAETLGPRLRDLYGARPVRPTRAEQGRRRVRRVVDAVRSRSGR